MQFSASATSRLAIVPSLRSGARARRTTFSCSPEHEKVVRRARAPERSEGATARRSTFLPVQFESTCIRVARSRFTIRVDSRARRTTFSCSPYYNSS